MGFGATGLGGNWFAGGVELGELEPTMEAAIPETRAGLDEGGIPIGSILVHNGVDIGRGLNRRMQRGSSILHGEMDALAQ